MKIVDIIFSTSSKFLGLILSLLVHGAIIYFFLKVSIDNDDIKRVEIDISSVDLVLTDKVSTLEEAASHASKSVESVKTTIPEEQNKAEIKKPQFEELKDLPTPPPDLKLKEDAPRIYKEPVKKIMPPPTPAPSVDAIEKKGAEASQAKVEAIPKLRKNIRPEYPKNCRKQGIEGTTLVHLKIDKHGEVVGASVKRSSGNIELDESALRAFRNAKFKPAMSGNKPIEYEVDIPAEFRLK